MLDDEPAAIVLLTRELQTYWGNSAYRQMVQRLDIAPSGLANAVFFDETGAALDAEAGPIRQLATGVSTRNVLFGLSIGSSRRLVWKRVSTSVQRGPAGEPLWFTVTMVDAIQEDPLATTLRTSIDNWRRIVDDTPVGICITNYRGIFEFANPAYLAFCDYAPADLIGQHFTLVVPERLRDLLSDAHDRFIAGAGEIRGEWTVVGRSGRSG